MTRVNRKPRGVLTVNAGSTSLRLAAFETAETPACIGEAHFPHLPRHDPGVLTEFVSKHEISVPDVVVHRVVHGGINLRTACLIDAHVESEIERTIPLAPLHNSTALGWIRAARAAFDDAVPQVAVFDTAFYAHMPAWSAKYALPQDLCEKHGIRRYGFHGLAHRSMLMRWHQLSESPMKHGRVISLQLGAGCSITATDHGQPVDTSMGFSPLEGLMMATRCGDLDPTVLLYLIDQGGYGIRDLEKILNEESGLRGVSRESADMERLLSRDDTDAELAVAMFCHRVRKYIGAYIAVLGGVDAILFGGGIGEHAPEIRARVLDDFSWADIRIDSERNSGVAHGGGSIHADDSVVNVWVTPVDEALIMVQEAMTVDHWK